MPAEAIVVSRPELAALKDAPIRESWIIEGAPVARAQELSRSVDGTTVTMHWSCTSGTFYWYFGIDETVQILEGEVIVRKIGEAETTLAVGDVALFRAGTWCIWHVPHRVRKIAICRDAMPRLAGSVLRLIKRSLDRLAPRNLDAPPGKFATSMYSINPNLRKTG
jgi:uncharacterized cupin superfamily protein